MSHSFKLDIQELSRFSNVYSLNCKWYTSIKDIKDQLHRYVNCPPSRMRLFHGSAVKNISNTTTLHDLGIEENGHVLRLVMDITSSEHVSIIPSKDIEVDKECKKLLGEVRRGLQQNKIPTKTDLLEGTGGVYFMKASTGARIAVFKPSDEEQGMPNNPKGHGGNGEHGLRDFMKPGEGYIHEAAAYMLDYMNFSNVPPTTIVHCEHPTFHYPGTRTKETFPKIGSIQSYCRAGDTFEDISSSMISIFELQKIAVLDIRLLNCDRNSSNILAKLKNHSTPKRRSSIGLRRDSRSSSVGSAEMESPGGEFIIFPDDFESARENSSQYQDSYELIPIDHGYCMPPELHIDEFDWAWMHCPQIAEKVDPEIYRYIMCLDIESMITKLKKELVGISDDSLHLMRVSHLLLREGVKAGLTLKAIACLIARMNEDIPSPLENALNVAADNAYRAIEMRSSRLNTRGDAVISKVLSKVDAGDARRLRANKPVIRSKKEDYTSTMGNGAYYDNASNMFQAKPFQSASIKEAESNSKTSVDSTTPANSTISSTSSFYLSRESSGSRTLDTGSPTEGQDGDIQQYFLIDLDETPKTEDADKKTLEQEYSPKSKTPLADSGSEMVASEVDNTNEHSGGIENEGVSLSQQLRGKPLIAMHTLDPYVLRLATNGLEQQETVDRKTHSPHMTNFSPLPLSSVTPSPDHRKSTFNSYRHQMPPPLNEAGSGFAPIMDGATSSECSSSYEKGSPKSMSEFMSKAFERRFLPIPLPRELDQAGDDTSDVAYLREAREMPREGAATRRSPFRSTASSPSLEILLASEMSTTGDEHSVSPKAGRGQLQGVKQPGPLFSSTSFKEAGTVLRRMDTYKDPFTQTLSIASKSDQVLNGEEVGDWNTKCGSLNDTTAVFSKESNRKLSSRKSAAALKPGVDPDLQPLSLTRVISLGAFESPPIYDEADSQRQTTRLRRNRRKNVSSTVDFQELRLMFATKAIHSLINKESRGASKGVSVAS